MLRRREESPASPSRAQPEHTVPESTAHMGATTFSSAAWGFVSRRTPHCWKQWHREGLSTRTQPAPASPSRAEPELMTPESTAHMGATTFSSAAWGFVSRRTPHCWKQWHP